MKLKAKYDWNNIENEGDGLLWSLAKWIGICEGEITDNGHNNCGSCYYDYKMSNRCSNCLVARHTMNSNCLDTPYEEFKNMRVDRIKYNKKEKNFLIMVYKKYVGPFTIKEFKKSGIYKMMLDQLLELQ